MNVDFKNRVKGFEKFPYKDFREDIEIGKYQKKSKYTYIGLDGESYDIRNNLNNLSGKRWLFFLNSVEVTSYPVNGEEGYEHKIRKIHPTPKPPQLMRSIIEFFTKEGEWVLDPFMGVGGTLLGSSLAKRNCMGFDIAEKYIDAYKKANASLHLKEQIALVEDARNIKDMPDEYKGFFDLVLTDPPYCNMQAKPKTGEKAKRNGGKFATPFTEDTRDIGNINYDLYLNELRDIIEKTVFYLKNGKYLVVFTKDLQPTKTAHNMLHADIISTLSKIDGLRFKGYKIWYDKTQNLYPFGYPFSYVVNQFHQFILIFKKEK